MAICTNCFRISLNRNNCFKNSLICTRSYNITILKVGGGDSLYFQPSQCNGDRSFLKLNVYSIYTIPRNISLLLILMKNIQRKVVETYLRLDKFSNATLILVLAPFWPCLSSQKDVYLLRANALSPRFLVSKRPNSAGGARKQLMHVRGM